jgi:hypothetical protein
VPEALSSRLLNLSVGLMKHPVRLEFGKPLPKFLLVFVVLGCGAFFGMSLYVVFAYDRSPIYTALMLIIMLVSFFPITRTIHTEFSYPKFRITDASFFTRDGRSAFGFKGFSLTRITDVKGSRLPFLAFRYSGRKTFFYLPFRRAERERLVSELTKGVNKSSITDTSLAKAEGI